VETLALNGGWQAWATTTKLVRFFFDLFYEMFPKQRRKCFLREKKFFLKTKMFLFRKYLRNECFGNESEIVFVLEMKIF